MINIDVKVGDIILTGKFRNKKTVVKTIGTDEYGMPTINGKKCCTFRKQQTSQMENLMEGSGIRKKTLISYIYKRILPFTTGFFRDNNWQSVYKIFKIFDRLKLDWSMQKTYYGNHKYDKTMPMERKTWEFKIKFINQRGRTDYIYGTLVAAGAGSVDDPLDRYDITVVLS